MLCLFNESHINQYLWSHNGLLGTILCPILWNLMTKDVTLDMSRTYPQNPPKSWTLSEKTPSIILYFFNAHNWFVKIWTLWKCTKSKKFKICLDDCWCMGGYMHHGFIKFIFKCPDRTCYPHELRTFCYVQDMPGTFPTKHGGLIDLWE